MKTQTATGADAAQEREGHRWFAALWNVTSAPGERRYGRKVIRPRLMGEAHGDVLEIGAGTGHSFEFYPSDARVIATDPDPHMLRRAARHLGDLGLEHIELRQANAESLPFDDARFDHVVTSLVLCSAGNVPRTLSEARRVLRPGGTFRFWEHVRNDDSRFWGTFQDVIRPVWSWFGAGCHPNRSTLKAIEEAGFRMEWVEVVRDLPFQPFVYGVARRE
jgi:ubiquinone/menaquinone biosynthesis C-methylase UbiE